MLGMFRVEKRDDYAYRRYDMRSVGVGPTKTTETAVRGRERSVRQRETELVQGAGPSVAEIRREFNRASAVQADYYEDEEDYPDDDDYYDEELEEVEGPLAARDLVRRLDRLEALDAAAKAYDESFDLRDLRDFRDLRELQLSDGEISHPPPYPDSRGSPRSHSPPRNRPVLTTIFFSFVNRYIAPHLPEDIQAILHDPPSLNDPASLVPLLRAAAPYTQYLLVLVALYVVWAFVTGIVFYLGRFLRFCFRIGPVLAIIAWVMASTGQGGIDVLFDALKAYAGEGAGNNRQAGRYGGAGGAGGVPRGAAMYEAGRRTRRRGPGGGERYDAREARGYYNNPRTRTRRNEPQEAGAGADMLSAFFNNDGLAGTVQEFVKRAVAKGTGLDWLFNQNQNDEQRNKRDGARTTRTR